MKAIWKGKRIQAKQGWYEFGKRGIALGEPVFVEQEWLPVKWDDEDDPTFNKLAGIELEIIPTTHPKKRRKDAKAKQKN